MAQSFIKEMDSPSGEIFAMQSHHKVELFKHLGEDYRTNVCNWYNSTIRWSGTFRESGGAIDLQHVVRAATPYGAFIKRPLLAQELPWHSPPAFT